MVALYLSQQMTTVASCLVLLGTYSLGYHRSFLFYTIFHLPTAYTKISSMHVGWLATHSTPILWAS